MKTILLISRCPPFPLHFGDRRIMWHPLLELSRRGYNIDLLALYDRDDDPQYVEEYRSAFRHIKLFREPRRAAPAYLRRLLQPAARYADSPEKSFCPPLWRSIADHLQRYEYDLVHCFGGVSVYEFHPLFAHLPNLITPYESHSLYLESAAAQGDWSARLRLPIVRRYERFMFTPYDRAVLITEADRAALCALQPALNAEVIPIGTDVDHFRPQSHRRDRLTLLFTGNFAYAPNQDAARLLAERILPQVRRTLPEARLQLVGVNPPAWLRDLAGEHIEVTGRVPDMRFYLARATVFVCPLRIGAGLKNKLLEAMAMGIPVVATPLSLAGIDVRDGQSALICEVSEFAETTARLLLDETLRQRLSQNGRALVEGQYDWAQTASRYEDLYDEICRRR